MLFIVLRYILRRQKNRFNQYIYWTVSFFVFLGTIAIIMILSVMNGFENLIKKNSLRFVPHLFLTGTQGYINIEDNTYLMLDKKLLNEVLYVQPLITFNIILQSAQSIQLGTVLGIDPIFFEPISNYLIYDTIDQLMPGKYRIILGSALARKLKISINEKVRVIVPSILQNTPIGYVPVQRVFTTSDFYITNDDIDNYQVLINQLDAATLMCYPLRCVTGLRLWVRDPFNLNYYNKLLLHNLNNSNWIWKDWSQYKGPLFQAMQMEKNVAVFLLILIMMISGFSIVSSLILFITEKKKDIAILRVCGLTSTQVVLLFMIQGNSSVIIGIIFGTILGILLSARLNQVLFFFKIIPETLELPIEIRYCQIFYIIFTICILISLIILYPSWKAASIHPRRVLYDR